MSITAKQFKNFSDTDFAWKFDGIEYSFPAGSTMFLEDFKAEHFAKHLIDRELTKDGVHTDNKTARDVLYAKCFPSAEVVTPVQALDIEENKKASKKKGKKAVVVEEEFADLNDK